MKGSGPFGRLDRRRQLFCHNRIDIADPAEMNFEFLGAKFGPGAEKQIKSLAHIGISNAERQRRVRAYAHMRAQPRGILGPSRQSLVAALRPHAHP